MDKDVRNTIWRNGRPLLASWIASASVMEVEYFAALGFDGAIIDMQHGPFGYADIYRTILALSASPTAAWVRVPSNDAAMIGRLLDAGADGIMCPVVNTRADAESFVSACRYPPEGIRSFGPVRAGIEEGAIDYFNRANGSVLTIAQIETAEGLENAQEILETPGLDMVFIGSFDLSISCGDGAKRDYSDEKGVARHKHIIDLARAAGVRIGMLGSGGPQHVTTVAEWGADMITVADDIDVFVDGMTSVLKAAHDALKTRENAA